MQVLGSLDRLGEPPASPGAQGMRAGVGEAEKKEEQFDDTLAFPERPYGEAAAPMKPGTGNRAEGGAEPGQIRVSVFAAEFGFRSGADLEGRHPVAHGDTDANPVAQDARGTAKPMALPVAGQGAPSVGAAPGPVPMPGGARTHGHSIDPPPAESAIPGAVHVSADGAFAAQAAKSGAVHMGVRGAMSVDEAKDLGTAPREAALGAAHGAASEPGRGSVQRSMAQPPPAGHLVLAQIRELVTAAHHGMEVRLEPEELGRVRFLMSAQDGGGAMTIVLERAETLELVRRHLDGLLRDLRQAGWDAVDVSLAGEGFDHSGTSQDGEVEMSPDPCAPEAAPAADASPSLRRIAVLVEGQMDLRL